MDVSICICTWNRAESLAQTLASLTGVQVPPPLTWEVIVCDNNCTDQTAEVIQQFQSSLPLKAIVEKRQGLSAARNACVAQATGDLVIFTDDDVRVGADWVSGYVQASRGHPEAAFFGGPIVPLYVAPPPRWFTPEVAKICKGIITWLDGGPADHAIGAGDVLPWGANMAFRRAALDPEPFNPRLGLVGGRLFTGEETDVFQTLLNRGCTGWYVAGCLVRHEVDRQRLSARYIFKRFWYIGRSAARRNGDHGLRGQKWKLLQAVKEAGGFVAGRARRDYPRSVEGLRKCGLHLGSLFESVFGRGGR